jgi:UDP-3-O-[3-hydroxymyristoyl] N-acetylglucosamine deacetylase
MADVVASGVDNLDIALSDGVGTRFDYDSNRAVVELLERKSECDTEKRTYRVKRGLSESERTVTQEGKTDSIAVEPSGGFFIDYRAGFPHASIGEQHYRFEVDSDSYQEDIMPARAIFFMPYFIPEPFLRRAIQPHYGVTDRNALMVGRRHEKQFRNRELPEGIYGNEEFVRHKIMDALGAIGLMGMQFVDTTFSFFKTGHGFDLYGLRELQTREIFEQVH